jgi:NAD(P)H-dependent FMN reductase
MDAGIKVAVIYGSTRKGRFCDKVVRWAADEIVGQKRFLLDVIDPALPSLAVSHQPGSNPSEISWRQRIADADAFVVVTPEYNHGYSAPLKSFIDSMGEEWHAKPVGFVSYGGISGGLRAVEQLRQVFAELHTVTVRDSVSFASAWEQFDAEGTLLSPERAHRRMEVLLAQLHWWAAALRNARHAVPYVRTA